MEDRLMKTCPMRALDVGLYDKMAAEYGLAEVYPLPARSTTTPSLILVPNRKYRASDTYTLTNFEEEIQAGGKKL